MVWKRRKWCLESEMLEIKTLEEVQMFNDVWSWECIAKVGWKASFIGSEKVKDMRIQGISGNVSLDVGIPMNYDKEVMKRQTVIQKQIFEE